MASASAFCGTDRRTASRFGVPFEFIAVRIARAFDRERDFRPVGGGNMIQVIRVVAPLGGYISAQSGVSIFCPADFCFVNMASPPGSWC
jgi:hypothetical protein